MTQAERQIRDSLERELNVRIGTPAGDDSVLEVPAAHKSVGPLRIRIDSDEITVFVGPTHCHFTRYDGDPTEKRIADALEFVRDVLSDRMVLWSCLCAGGAYRTERGARFRVPWPVRRYVWSGPLAR